MSGLYWTFCATVVFLLATLAPAQAGGNFDNSDNTDPLFRGTGIIEVTMRLPIKALLNERPTEKYLPGTLEITGADGEPETFNIGIRARGNYRLENCAFPPLRVNFRKSETEGTLFDQQDKLKLVTHCRDSSGRYDQGVLREYLAYRILNLMTDFSYRPRLLRVRYADAGEQRKDRVHYGFFIEHKSRLAHRIGRPEIEISRTTIESLNPAATNLTSIFQYLIGNTDFSPIAGASGESCCHNYTLFGSEGEPIVPIPYDFDMSGFVNAPYAEPNPRFRIRNVRQRLYRGRCANNAHVQDNLRAFQDNREAILALVGDRPELSVSTRKSLLDYIERFFKTIDDPRLVQKRLIDACV